MLDAVFEGRNNFLHVWWQAATTLGIGDTVTGRRADCDEVQNDDVLIEVDRLQTGKP